MSNVHVQQAMDLLSGGLDHFITSKMEPVIGGLEWTSVLSELDKMRGKGGWTYERKDVALQLRMLTERLGNLGYPFDEGDKNRTLSSYGSVLRIVRRRWAHNEVFGTFDALSAVDAVRTILAHVGDESRTGEASELRTSLLTDLVEGADQGAVDKSSDEFPEGPASDADSSVAEEDEQRALHGAVPWEPWAIAVIGEQTDLDSIRSLRVKEMVRSLIEDVAEAEGPVHKNRLVKLVGYGFGFSRLTTARGKRILNQIPNASVVEDRYGFVWPEGIDKDEWLIHRTSAEVQRRFEDISPIEIANAAVSLMKDDDGLSQSELRRRVVLQFGRKKKSKGAERQLDLGIAYAISSGRLPSAE